MSAKAQVARGKGDLKHLPMQQHQPTIMRMLVASNEDISVQPKGHTTSAQLTGSAPAHPLPPSVLAPVRCSDVSEATVERDETAEIGEGGTQGPQEERSESNMSVEEECLDEEVDALVSSDSEDDVEIVEPFAADHPFLADFKHYLMSRHGRSRSDREAKQIVTACARYLAYAGPVLDKTHLYDPTKLDTYLRSLNDQGKKASTQHSTLCRIQQGLKYVLLSLDPAATIEAQKCQSLVSNWLSTLGKEVRKEKRVHLEEMSDRGRAALSEIDMFARCPAMIKAMQSAVAKVKAATPVLQPDLRQLTVWLAGCLMHSNAQRPGAIINATIDEYNRATVEVIGREPYKTIVVVSHKTSTTGSARLTMDRHLSQMMECYTGHIRQLLEGSSSNFLFPNREGKRLDHLSRHVSNLAKKLGFNLPKTATETRHSAATAAAECSQQERASVAAAMSHSQRTQDLYYTLTKGRKHAVEGYRIMEGLRQSEVQESSTRGVFTEDHTESVTEYFADHIASRQPPSIQECREFVSQHHIDRTAKQVRDKVRNLIGRS